MPVLAIVGGSLFVSGVFVLAAAGHAYSLAAHLFILGSAIILAFPLLLVTLLVAGGEALLGRAWAKASADSPPPIDGFAPPRPARGGMLRSSGSPMASAM